MLIRQNENDISTNETTEAFQFEDLRQKADAYLANVRQQAQKIQQKTQSDLEAWREQTISNVKQETEALRKDAQTTYDQAQKKGYNDGFANGSTGRFPLSTRRWISWSPKAGNGRRNGKRREFSLLWR